MVRITDGKNEFSVTLGAYTSIYKYQGYEILNDKIPVASEVPSDKVDEDEIFCIDVMEKPIGQWSKEEVKRFALIKDIDITGTKNVGEAKEIIKQFIGA